MKATLTQAEEIAHLQVGGTATFAMLMRPEADVRQVDASAYGETTNKVIAKYGLPIPEVFPPGNGPIPTPAPTPIITPAPSGSPHRARHPDPSHSLDPRTVPGPPTPSMKPTRTASSALGRTMPPRGAFPFAPLTRRASPATRSARRGPGGRTSSARARVRCGRVRRPPPMPPPRGCECGHVPRRVDDPSRPRQEAGGEVALRGDPLVGVRGHETTPDEAAALDVGFARDEPDLVAGLGVAGLDQFDRLDDHGGCAGDPACRNRGFDPRPDSRMDDRLEVAKGRRIREDEPAERRPIQRA